MLDTPDWCISAKRSWASPPRFFDDKGQLLLTEKSPRRRRLLKTNTAQHPGTPTPEKILGTTEWETVDPPSGTIENRKSKSKLVQRRRHPRVWFRIRRLPTTPAPRMHPSELGYPRQPLPRSPTSTALVPISLPTPPATATAPFKQVLTHGFIVEKKAARCPIRSNTSRSKPALKEFGATSPPLGLQRRLQSDTPCSRTLQNIAKRNRKIPIPSANLLGNLYDLTIQNRVELDSRALLGQLEQKHMHGERMLFFPKRMRLRINTNFTDVQNYLYEFCNVEISAFYAKVSKIAFIVNFRIQPLLEPAV